MWAPSVPLLLLFQGPKVSTEALDLGAPHAPCGHYCPSQRRQPVPVWTSCHLTLGQPGCHPSCIFFKSQLNGLCTLWPRVATLLSWPLFGGHSSGMSHVNPQDFLKREALSHPGPSPSTGQWAVRGTHHCPPSLPATALPPLVVSIHLFFFFNLSS
jgi:hypothetical protein